MDNWKNDRSVAAMNAPLFSIFNNRRKKQKQIIETKEIKEEGIDSQRIVSDEHRVVIDLIEKEEESVEEFIPREKTIRRFNNRNNNPVEPSWPEFQPINLASQTFLSNNPVNLQRRIPTKKMDELSLEEEDEDCKSFFEALKHNQGFNRPLTRGRVARRKLRGGPSEERVPLRNEGAHYTCHPLLTRLYDQLNSHQQQVKDDVGERVTEHELWTSRYCPRMIEEIMGDRNRRNAKVLKAWLQEVALKDDKDDDVDHSKKDKKVKSISRRKINNKNNKKRQIFRTVEKSSRSRKRQKGRGRGDEMKGFIVSDDDDDDGDDTIYSRDIKIDVSSDSIDSPSQSSSSKGRKDKHYFEEEEEEEFEFKKLSNLILLRGPSGAGKTSTVYTVANQLGFEVFEVNPGGLRSRKEVERLVGDVSRNHVLSSSSSSNNNKHLHKTFSGSSSSSDAKNRSSNATCKLSFIGDISEESQGGRPKKKDLFEGLMKKRMSKKRSTSTISSLLVSDNDRNLYPSEEEKQEEQDETETTSQASRASTNQNVQGDSSKNGGAEYTYSMVKPRIKRKKQSLILVEEVDVVFQADKDFWLGLISLISSSMRPVIMTCTTTLDVPLRELPFQMILSFERLDRELASMFLRLVCSLEVNKKKKDKEEDCSDDLPPELIEDEILRFFEEEEQRELSDGYEYLRGKRSLQNQSELSGSIDRSKPPIDPEDYHLGMMVDGCEGDLGGTDRGMIASGESRRGIDLRRALNQFQFYCRFDSANSHNSALDPGESGDESRALRMGGGEEEVELFSFLRKRAGNNGRRRQQKAVEGEEDECALKDVGGGDGIGEKIRLKNGRSSRARADGDLESLTWQLELVSYFDCFVELSNEVKVKANEQRYARQRRDDQQVLIENRTITERQQSQVMTIDEREEDQDFERGGLFVLEDWLGYERILCEPSDRLSNSDEDHDETQGRANDCGGDPSMVRILLKALIDDEKINYTNFFNRRRRMFREVESLRRALLPRNRNSSSREEEYYEEEEDERKERSYWSQKGRSEEEFVEYLMTLSRIVKVEDSRKLLMEKEGEGRRVEGEKGKVEGCDETRFLEGGGEMRNGLRRSQRSRGRTRNYFLGGSHHNQDDDHRFERVFDFEKSTLRRIRNFSL